MRKILLIVMLVVLIMLVGCGAVSKTTLDYGDAESFEAALVNGENLEGKTVSFVAGEVHPQSAFGYNVWAGEHLNFISNKNPDIKEGDVVTVKVTTVESNLGSWLITYEKIDNAVIGDITIVNSERNINSSVNSEGANHSADTDFELETEDIVVKESEEDSVEIEEEATIEYVDADIVAFKGYFGNPQVSAYVAFRNTSNYNIRLQDARIEYQDNDGNLLAVDDMLTCIPNAVKPGQVGYMYSYYYDLDGIDLSNGLTFVPDAQIYEADNFYEIEVSDVSFKSGDYLDLKVTARGTNNTGKDQDLAEPGAIYFDKDNKVIGFCYGLESFANGQKKAFDISGDMLSEEYSASDVDHVEVYIQGYSWY